MATPGIHPRRLFCSASPPETPSHDTSSGIDGTSCVKPSLVVQQERQMLLAPSPRSPAILRTHVEVRALERDIDSMVQWVKRLAANVREGGEIGGVDSMGESEFLHVVQLGSLRDAISELIDSVSLRAAVTETIATAIDAGELSLVETPKNASSHIKLSESHLLSEDVAHLRTIQKEVRGLFYRASVSISPIRIATTSPARQASTTLSSRTAVPSSPATPASSEGPQTATKISRVLAQSPPQVVVGNSNQTLSEIGSGFSQLTLSPGTSLFETVKTNPWFQAQPKGGPRRSSVTRGYMEDVVETDSPVSAVIGAAAAPAMGSYGGNSREILAADESLTVSALQAAMAKRRARPTAGGASDLVAWLRKQDDRKRSQSTLNIYNHKASSHHNRFGPDSAAALYRN